MFLKKKRVTKEIFNKIMKEGQTLSGSFFVFKYIIDYKLPQYAFVVPQKITKKAINRNKLRRQGYNFLKIFDIKKGVGIFFYKKDGINASPLKIKNDLNFLLKKTKLIN